MLFEKKSILAQNHYRKKISEIVQHLANEYRESLNLELHDNVKNKAATRLQSHNRQEEHMVSFNNQRKKLFLFHLNKNGAYFTVKEQLKASVVEIVREV